MALGDTQNVDHFMSEFYSWEKTQTREGRDQNESEKSRETQAMGSHSYLLYQPGISLAFMKSVEHVIPAPQNVTLIASLLEAILQAI